MFVSDKLIFLQLPKSGCNSSAGIIKQFAGGEQLQIHLPLQDYNTTKKIAGNVRNPWDWYVSLWSYGCMGRGGLRERLIQYNSKISTESLYSFVYPIYERMFKDIDKWNYLYSDVYNPELFRLWLKEMYATKNKRWLGLGYKDHPTAEYAGYLTYRYGLLYLKNFDKKEYFDNYTSEKKISQLHDELFLLDFVIFTENLVDETIDVLVKLGYNAHKDQIKREKVVENKSKHLRVSEYYNDESLEMVAQKEKLIVEKYGYTGPSK